MRKALVFLTLITLVVLSVLIDAPPASTASPLQPQPIINGAALRQVLRVRLKATTPAQFAFINKVVVQVEAENLPLELVFAVLRKSQREKPRLPFFYFQRAIIVEAAKLNVTI